MAITYTRDQKKVINTRDKNILVAAAAGSGKTAVLVERIVQIVTQPEQPIDIDRLLVVTFTKAAAAEMRERISQSLANKYKERPDNDHIQNQLTLLHNAQITTIDSFCLFVLRNNFNEVGLDPSFRVADEGEIKLLMADVLGELLEEKYHKGEEGFLRMVEVFSTNDKETALEENILKMYQLAMSYPWPKDWLHKCGQEYAQRNAPYMQYMTTYIFHILEGCLERFEYALTIAKESDGPYMYEAALEADVALVLNLLTAKDYEELSIKMGSICFQKLMSKKDESVRVEKKEYVKSLRDMTKKDIGKLQSDYFFFPFGEMLSDLEKSAPIIVTLAETVSDYMDAVQARKREKNMIDFSDMEHYALQILVEKDGDKVIPSKAALGYKDYFYEILIDEYQDSNLVQEYLLKSIAKDGPIFWNRFMVGDVKQSIYKFRLARPDIFMEKFDRYQESSDELTVGNEVRIDLHQNFRSRGEILEGCNLIFSQIMQKDLGGVSYDEAARLNWGATYPETQEKKIELFIVDSSIEDSSTEDSSADDFSTENVSIENFSIEKGKKLDVAKERALEAAFIAGKIQEVIAHAKVTDKKTGLLREVRYSDIVILLRTNAGWDEVFKKALRIEGIPVYVDSKDGYFSTVEVQFILDYLKIIDNPLQDIPLCGALFSLLFGFNEEEVAQIRGAANSREECLGEREKLYTAMQWYEESGDELSLRKKVHRFLSTLLKYRDMVSYVPIHDLIRSLYENEHFYEVILAMPDGQQRCGNLDMLLEKAVQFENTSYHGLFHFNRYIELLKKYKVDFGEATNLDETANVVRIMSIHKSKGLEFPVCIVAGLAKEFNSKDFQKSFVIEGDFGVGADAVDLERRVVNPTIRKKALAVKMKVDSYGEELRILYVALTRAKEKLIMTGTINDLQKRIIENQLLCTREETALPFAEKIRAKCYLDFILMALLRNKSMAAVLEMYSIPVPSTHVLFKEGPDIHVQIVNKDQIVVRKITKTLEKDLWKNQLFCYFKNGKQEQKLAEIIEKNLTFEYPHKEWKDLYTKTTVSALKMDAMEENVHVLFEETKNQRYTPTFIRKETQITGAVRGSAFHKILELLSFEEVLSESMVSEKIEELERRGKLSNEFARALLPQKIADFMQSNIAKRMIEAKKNKLLYKEQPFVISVSANKVKAEFPETETILVQGIIDVYFEEEDGLVVVDYKTDQVKTKEELVLRYQTQLDYYAEAIEKLTGKKVKEKWMYSFALKEEIRL